MKRYSIWMKVDLYEVFLSYIIHCILFYVMTILTLFFFARFVVSLSLGEMSSESIGQKYLSRKSKKLQMNSVGESC